MEIHCMIFNHIIIAKFRKETDIVHCVRPAALHIHTSLADGARKWNTSCPHSFIDRKRIIMSGRVENCTHRVLEAIQWSESELPHHLRALCVCLHTHESYGLSNANAYVIWWLCSKSGLEQCDLTNAPMMRAIVRSRTTT